ncbi:hypothetical protein [Paenibacillus sp. 1001270B_150601_E10]|uniref:hypothetical protein n=1 Tax=Paenibacillus sp. 1001270B_150601_E10 TaxID=2787079 RepID=UPI00189F9235|nr:hypothetical protein [Paenibacillus sp. 1001270B_150601_E10]
MSIPFKQNERSYTFDCLPKGEQRLQFIFRNETNQPLCDLLIKISTKKFRTHELGSGIADIKSNEILRKVEKNHCELESSKLDSKKKKKHKLDSAEGVSISSRSCDCSYCKKKRKEKCKHDSHHPKYGKHEHSCCDHHHHHDPCKKKKKDCHKPQSVKISRVKIQTTFCADVLEWCPPSKKVCIDFPDVLKGKCIPFYPPNNVLILTIEFTKPLRGDEVLIFEPGSGYGPVLINEDFCSDDYCK